MKSSSEYVKLVLDTGHFGFGSGGSEDPNDFLEKHFARTRFICFKDFSPKAMRFSKRNQWDYLESVQNVREMSTIPKSQPQEAELVSNALEFKRGFPADVLQQ